MLAPTRNRIDYADLVRDDRVHGSVYYDPDIFADELEKIWYRQWVFIGHESEFPNPGDYRTERIGRQPIIIARDSQRRIRAYLNRCRHRANTVCEKRRGHAMTLHVLLPRLDLLHRRPPAGRAVSATTTARNFRKQDHGLIEVPRLDSYRGFLFASLAAQGPSLREHLGLATTLIDRYCDISPSGEVAMNVGVFRMKVKTNWKMWIENSVDGYHVPSTHASNFYMAQITENQALKNKTAATGKGVFSVIKMRDLGGGHSELDMRPQRRITGMTYSSDWSQGVPESARKAPTWPGWKRAWGPERARQMLTDGPAHAVIYPNLFLIFQDIRWCVPVSVNETHLVLRRQRAQGRARRDQPVAPAPRGRRLRSGRLSAGRRSRRSGSATTAGWRRARTSGSTCHAASTGRWSVTRKASARRPILSELPIRAQWQHYRSLMTAEDA